MAHFFGYSRSRLACRRGRAPALETSPVTPEQPTGRATGGPRRWSGRIGMLLLAVQLGSGVLVGCKRTPGEGEGHGPPPVAEPEHFSFSLPSQFVELPLRGEGSETLRVPPNASLRSVGDAYRIEAGTDFALDVKRDPPPLAGFKSGVEKPVLEEADLLIFKSRDGYQFVVVRELVPEWDESERRRFSCESAGRSAEKGSEVGQSPGVLARADAPGYPRAAVQNMVAACRSLGLPRLE
jgi:hypothetical protein